MNLNAALLRLEQMRAKMDRGEELNEREAAYVKALWARLRPVVARLKEELERASGTTIDRLSTRLEVEELTRRRTRAEREARMRRWGRA